MKASDIKPLGVLELKEKNKFIKKYETSSAAELQLRLRSVEIKKERDLREIYFETVMFFLFTMVCFGMGYGEKEHDVQNGILWAVFGVLFGLILIKLTHPDKLSLIDEETALKVLLAAKMSGEKI